MIHPLFLLMDLVEHFVVDAQELHNNNTINNTNTFFIIVGFNG